MPHPKEERDPEHCPPLNQRRQPRCVHFSVGLNKSLVTTTRQTPHHWQEGQWTSKTPSPPPFPTGLRPPLLMPGDTRRLGAQGKGILPWWVLGRSHHTWQRRPHIKEQQVRATLPVGQKGPLHLQAAGSRTSNLLWLQPTIPGRDQGEPRRRKINHDRLWKLIKTVAKGRSGPTY